MLKSTTLTLIAFLLISMNLQGQTVFTIPLIVDKHHLNINYFPFDSIQVVDNRFDTTKIFAVEDGHYPPVYLNFKESASLAIKDYINSAVKPFPKGNKKLLIDIEEFHIPNKTFFARKKDSALRIENLRDYILVYMKLYYKTDDNRYKKLVTIDKEYYTYGAQVNKQFPIILNDIIEASCINVLYASTANVPKKLRYLLKDTASFKYSTDSNDISLEQINLQAKQAWADCQIIKDSNYKNGFYSTFDDFRNNSVTPGSIGIKYDEKDSLYIASLPNGSKHFYPWAICENNNLYIQLYKNGYLQLHKQGNTFYFDVPYSLPDIYALLSIEALKQDNYAESNVTGNGFADLLAGTVSGTINMIIEKAKINKTKNEGFQFNNRHCFVDMFYGDIVY